ncbi:MAG: hypothetical protein GX287_02830 [Fusobacteria bacterium]|nr:hypothetical protein [Fusobacteriota bacterium]
MKKKILAVAIFMISFHIVLSSIVVQNSNGEKILLKSNGTWGKLYEMPVIDVYIEDDDIKGEYRGESLDGIANGYGIAKGIDLYEGNFLNGKLNGFGVYHWGQEEFKGDYYEGNFVNGEMHGEGIMHFSNGEIYHGTWVKSVMEGYGKFYFANGVKYEGEFRNNIFNGNGKIVISENLFYEDYFVNGVAKSKKKYERFLKNIHSYRREEIKQFAELIVKIKNNLDTIITSNEQVALTYRVLEYQKDITNKEAEDKILKLQMANEFLYELKNIYDEYKDIQIKEKLTE